MAFRLRVAHRAAREATDYVCVLQSRIADLERLLVQRDNVIRVLVEAADLAGERGGCAAR